MFEGPSWEARGLEKNLYLQIIHTLVTPTLKLINQVGLHDKGLNKRKGLWELTLPRYAENVKFGPSKSLVYLLKLKRQTLTRLAMR